MTKKYLYLFFLYTTIITPHVNKIKEDEPENTPRLELSGYIKSEAFYDNRQLLSSLASEQLVYPLKKDFDPQHNDINARGQGQMVPFESRIRMRLTDLKANQGDITGILEVDFIGKEDTFDIDFYFNLCRQYQAYAQIDWDHLSILLGQTWHPTTIPEVSPNTISFNSGRPIEQYTRAPQCTVAYNFYPEQPTWVTGWKTMYQMYYDRQVRLSLTATSEVDFVSDGPDGLLSRYMRLAIVPNMHLQVKGYWNGIIIGAGFDYKRLNPRLQSPLGFRVREYINSVAALWFIGINRSTYHINCKVTWGQNMTDRDSIGGYAVKAGSIDPIRGSQKYTNINAATFWTEIILSRFKRAEPALFFGVAKNLGASSPIVLNPVNPNEQRTIFGLGTNVNTVFRVVPRLRMKINKIVFAVEYEYTRAAYGTITIKGKVIDTLPVANNRVLFAAFYYF